MTGRQRERDCETKRQGVTETGRKGSGDFAVGLFSFFVAMQIEERGWDRNATQRCPRSVSTLDETTVFACFSQEDLRL